MSRKKALIPIEEVGTNEPGHNVEGEGSAFRRAGTIKADNPQGPLDNEDEGVTPCTVYGEFPGAKDRGRTDSESGRDEVKPADKETERAVSCRHR